MSTSKPCSRSSSPAVSPANEPPTTIARPRSVMVVLPLGQVRTVRVVLEVDHDGVLRRAGDDHADRLGTAGVLLPVHDVRLDVDEVARVGLGHGVELVADPPPAHTAE